MEKFQGIFDQGFSGILEDSSRKTMPDYIEKLAESEIDYEPPEIDIPNIIFDKDLSLSRANELTSDVSRESNVSNRFTKEKVQREEKQETIKSIDRFVEAMFRDNKNFEQIQSSLLKKFPSELVYKYLESKICLVLNKFSFLGFENIEEKIANIVEISNIDFKIRRSTVHDILEKFSKFEYVTNTVVKEYKKLLGTKRPIYVASKFLFSLNDIKNKYYEQKEARVAFQRDSDEKDLSIRDINNNVSKNKNIERQNVFSIMLNDFKQGINERLSRSEISKKIARVYGYEKFKEFYGKYQNQITKLERFSNRQNFDTDFASSTLQGVELQPKSKPMSIDNRLMLNYAFDLLTFGNDLDFVKKSIKKQFGLEVTNKFLEENESKLNKHYGQIGYLFIDSNIYSNCNNMSDIYTKLQHPGSKLIYSVKSNQKCSNCSLNKDGTCEKVGLLISNNPLVRSPRAAKRVFDKASTFLPKDYVDSYVSQIKESNLELISKFTLGISNVLDEEKKNIGKRASKDRSITTETQESFAPLGSNVDFETTNSVSSIVDEVLGILDKKAFKTKIKDWDVDIKSFISKGQDPTKVYTISLKKGNDKILLKEFQGIVSIDWRAPKNKGQKIPNDISVTRFGGEDNTKELNKLLETVDAPTWTEISEIIDNME